MSDSLLVHAMVHLSQTSPLYSRATCDMGWKEPSQLEEPMAGLALGGLNHREYQFHTSFYECLRTRRSLATGLMWLRSVSCAPTSSGSLCPGARCLRTVLRSAGPGSRLAQRSCPRRLESPPARVFEKRIQKDGLGISESLVLKPFVCKVRTLILNSTQIVRGAASRPDRAAKTWGDLLALDGNGAAAWLVRFRSLTQCATLLAPTPGRLGLRHQADFNGHA